MRRRRSTRSVIKLLAAAAVATASIVSLRLSTPPARGELPLCEDIEEIDSLFYDAKASAKLLIEQQAGYLQ